MPRPRPQSLGKVRQSFFRLKGNCSLHILETPQSLRLVKNLTFDFVKDKVSIDGHSKSIFGANNGVLFFVHYYPYGEGATVTAHDLKTGKQLWETNLQAAGLCNHSAYGNEVFMTLYPAEIVIAGRETCGNYIEVLDQATGYRLAHQAFEDKDFPKREDYKQE
jgi:hypothetical protein